MAKRVPLYESPLLSSTISNGVRQVTCMMRAVRGVEAACHVLVFYGF